MCQRLPRQPANALTDNVTYRPRSLHTVPLQGPTQNQYLSRQMVLWREIIDAGTRVALR